jgi:hypothetical protein
MPASKVPDVVPEEPPEEAPVEAPEVELDAVAPLVELAVAEPLVELVVVVVVVLAGPPPHAKTAVTAKQAAANLVKSLDLTHVLQSGEEPDIAIDPSGGKE